MPPLELHPRNSTALLDSIGKLITGTPAEIAALAEDNRLGSVIVAIMTDGNENSSPNGVGRRFMSFIEQQTNESG